MGTKIGTKISFFYFSGGGFVFVVVGNWDGVCDRGLLLASLVDDWKYVRS
jgi:hypothetical protein